MPEKRRYFSYSVYDLIEEYEKNKSNIDILNEILHELSHRKARTAVKLRNKLTKELANGEPKIRDLKIAELVKVGRSKGYLKKSEIKAQMQNLITSDDEQNQLIASLRQLGLNILEEHASQPFEHDELIASKKKVQSSIEEYFLNINDVNKPKEIYEIVMAEAEKALIKAAMKFTLNNKSDAAKILGISRSTLIKKIKNYHI